MLHTFLYCFFLSNKTIFYKENLHTGIENALWLQKQCKSQKCKNQQTQKPTAAERKWKTFAFSEKFLFIPLNSQTLLYCFPSQQ